MLQQYCKTATAQNNVSTVVLHFGKIQLKKVFVWEKNRRIFWCSQRWNCWLAQNIGTINFSTYEREPHHEPKTSLFRNYISSTEIFRFRSLNQFNSVTSGYLAWIWMRSLFLNKITWMVNFCSEFLWNLCKGIKWFHPDHYNWNWIDWIALHVAH